MFALLETRIVHIREMSNEGESSEEEIQSGRTTSTEFLQRFFFFFLAPVVNPLVFALMFFSQRGGY